MSLIANCVAKLLKVDETISLRDFTKVAPLEDLALLSYIYKITAVRLLIIDD